MISSAVCRHSAYWLIGCAGTAALSVVEMCAGTTKMLVFAGTLCRHTMLSVGMKGEPLFFFFLLFSFLGSREAPQALCFATKGLSRQEIRVFLNFALRTAHDPTSGPGEYFFCNFSNQAKPKHRLTTGGHLGVNYIKARLGTPPHTPKHLPIARALSNDARTFERTRENAHGGSGLGVLAAVGPPTHSKTPQSPTGMCEMSWNAGSS